MLTLDIVGPTLWGTRLRLLSYCLVIKICSIPNSTWKLKIKTIRIDNALDLMIPRFILDKGIIYWLSCMETPQQNVVVERKHQHLVSIARTLLIQLSFLMKFWGKAILMATHMINKLPTRTLNSKTPFQCPFHKPPNYH